MQEKNRPIKLKEASLEESDEEPSKNKSVMKGTQIKLPLPDRSQNYCAIFGTLPNESVEAESDLAAELIQLFAL